MTDPIEKEHLQDFNDRLSEWVASQGFWFQIRHSMSGTGVKGQMTFHLLRLGFRLLIFLFLVAIGIWVYLVKRTEGGRFTAALNGELKAGLSASEVEIGGFNRLQGQLEINRLAAEGGDETFFTAMEARVIRCKMGLVDGLIGTWNPGVISVSKLDLNLRAGADDVESANKLAEALFRRPEGIAINTFEVADTNLRWGYSDRTEGSIESSAMRMQRTPTGWRMSFKGGVFRQNWLRSLDIVSLIVVCEPSGIVFETAQLKNGAGTVDFSGLQVTGGERPLVRGVAKIRNISLGEVMPTALRTFVEGTFSGDFKVSGSTNTSDGIALEGQVVLDGKDVISLRERIHLLKALSVVDYSRNYHRVDFREGSFQMKTVRGGMDLTEVNLKADDLFTLEGKLSVRLPTREEIEAAVARGAGTERSPLFAGEDDVAEAVEALRPSNSKSDLSLRRAGLESLRSKDPTQPQDPLTLDRLGLSIEMRRLQDQASDRLSRMLRYEGIFRVTIPNDAFERASHLRQIYPVDAATNRIPIRVPLEGYLYELTLKQAEDIYEQGRR